ncbi:unnamed protein product, partial [Brachionus calyciflorus]
ISESEESIDVRKESIAKAKDDYEEQYKKIKNTKLEFENLLSTRLKIKNKSREKSVKICELESQPSKKLVKFKTEEDYTLDLDDSKYEFNNSNYKLLDISTYTQPNPLRSQFITDNSSNTNKDDQNKSSIQETLSKNNKKNSFIKNYSNLNSTNNLNRKYENNFTENDYLLKDSSFFEDPYLRSLIMEPLRNLAIRKLDLSTPKFSGNHKEDVEDWLFKVNQGFRFSKIKDKDKLSSVINFVSDLPLLLLRKQIECNGSWLKYKAELGSTFVDVDRIHKIRSELVNLNHKEGMSIEYYISKFQRLTNRLSSLSEEEKIF